MHPPASTIMAHKSPFYRTTATKRAGRTGSRASRAARMRQIAALLAENAALRARIHQLEQDV